MSIAPDILNPRMGGYEPIDCEVQDRDTLYILAREDTTQMPAARQRRGGPSEGQMAKRLFVLRLNEPDKPWGLMHLTGLGTSMCAMVHAPQSQIAVMDSHSKVWMKDADSNGFQPRMASRAEGGLQAGGIKRAKSFGAELMACTTNRQLFVRKAPGHWELLGDPMPEPKGLSFEDFDRFDANDLYAVGDPGDVWHFDGTHWRKRRFPSKWGLSAVCCAGDGNVYIAAGTTIFRGRGDQWQRLSTKVQLVFPIQDLVWYEDRLWAGTHRGLLVLEGDHLVVPEDVAHEFQHVGANLAARDGVLLLASTGGAAFRRDGQWTTIFSQYDARTWYANHPGQAWAPPLRA